MRRASADHHLQLLYNMFYPAKSLEGKYLDAPNAQAASVVELDRHASVTGRFGQDGHVGKAILGRLLELTIGLWCRFTPSFDRRTIGFPGPVVQIPQVTQPVHR